VTISKFTFLLSYTSSPVGFIVTSSTNEALMSYENNYSDTLNHETTKLLQYNSSVQMKIMQKQYNP
jgi:hypothetical protein